MKMLLLITAVLISAVVVLQTGSPEAGSGGAPAIRDPRIVIRKADRTLDLFDGKKPIRSYAIVLGFDPAGDKGREGDGKTPEGEFYIFTKNPESKFYLSLGISYPSAEDAERGLRDGVISSTEHRAILDAVAAKRMPPQKTALGGEIYIHGGGLKGDWTEGCIAMKDEDIRELFDAVGVGAAVTIQH